MVAITGANGLLGNFIAKELIGRQIPCRAIVREKSNLELLNPILDKLEIQTADVLDMPSLLKVLKGTDCIVHAAGLVSFNPRKRSKIFQTNVEGTRNIVNTCLQLGIPRLIHISSVAALGKPKSTNLVTEDTPWAAGTPGTDYAESKFEAELEIFRGMEEGLHVSIVNPSVILAPIRTGQSSAQLFTYANKAWGFYGEGTMNYVDVRDVASLVEKLVNGNWNGHRFIASAGVCTMKEILSEISDRLGKKRPSIPIPPTVAGWVARLEELRAMMTASEPLLSRQSVRILSENFIFQNTKALEKLSMQFKTLQESLDWCCSEFRQNKQ